MRLFWQVTLIWGKIILVYLISIIWAYIQRILVNISRVLAFSKFLSTLLPIGKQNTHLFFLKTVLKQRELCHSIQCFNFLIMKHALEIKIILIRELYWSYTFNIVKISTLYDKAGMFFKLRNSDRQIRVCLRIET